MNPQVDPLDHRLRIWGLFIACWAMKRGCRGRYLPAAPDTISGSGAAGEPSTALQSSV